MYYSQIFKIIFVLSQKTSSDLAMDGGKLNKKINLIKYHHFSIVKNNVLYFHFTSIFNSGQYFRKQINNNKVLSLM